ncbi:methylaspartate mutase [Streptomyces sp. NPDC005970]|uniref:methylaspartate mutase n=1 Tax=Streptomyces sp. NPDC005970 TaxID=3156723 RepID=UPI0033D391FB
MGRSARTVAEGRGVPRPSVSFGAFVCAAQRRGELVVQPRMGFAAPAAMRRGLLATKRAAATTVGTLTLDSFTRTGDKGAALRALGRGEDLNGYPIVAHGPATTRAVLDGIHGPDFPVQVRHGSAAPQEIFRTLILSGLDATEGGPASYCLPYGRRPLAESLNNWRECCELLARVREFGCEPHLETFGGCMMGQLCPPSLLIALSVLEGVFFRAHGLRSVSLSYAQQTHPLQDTLAVNALRVLAGELLTGIDWHITLYTYMGVYPRTEGGARLLNESAARLAKDTGAARLIVKTAAEALRIPTVEENIEALESAGAAAAAVAPATGSAPPPDTPGDNQILAEARALVEAVLDLHPDPGQALLLAFERGFLDVPFCLHPDNPQRARSYLDPTGWLRWSDIGAMPIGAIAEVSRHQRMASADLLSSLTYVERRFDALALQRESLPAQPPQSATSATSAKE